MLYLSYPTIRRGPSNLVQFGLYGLLVCCNSCYLLFEVCCKNFGNAFKVGGQVIEGIDGNESVSAGADDLYLMKCGFGFLKCFFLL